MKIGDKVIITYFPILPDLVGCVGTIKEEQLPSSQLAMVSGQSETKWIVQLDDVVYYEGQPITECPVEEANLMVC